MMALCSLTRVGPAGWITGLPGPWEVVIVLLVILLLFGGKKLPELARGLGRGLRTFKRELSGIETDLDEKPDEPEQQADEQKAQPDNADETAQPDQSGQDRQG